MTIDLTDEQRGVIARAEKMLKLAAGNQNPHEAEVAMNKAMALLAEYNLDVATVEREGGQDGKREDTKVKGGLYHWQRDLWKRVAELNFCYYFTLNRWDPQKKRRVKVKDSWGDYTGKTEVVTGGYTFEHRLVGRVVNTRSSIGMAQYLEGEIERLARERFPRPVDFFIQEAIAYREGMADEVEHKLRKAREGILADEAQRQQDAYEKAKAAGGVAGFALTIAGLAQSEAEKNDDFIHGEGYTAKRKEAEAKAAEQSRVRRATQVKWALENPEEAARIAKEREEEDRKYWARRRGGYRGGSASPQEKRRDRHGSYYAAGQERGEKISLHRQADATERKRIR